MGRITNEDNVLRLRSFDTLCFSLRFDSSDGHSYPQCFRPNVSLSRCGSRTFLDLISELHDPKPRVDVVEIDQSIVRLRAPGEWQIRAVAFDVAGPNAANLAALSIQVAAQFAGDIDDAAAAAVVTHVHLA